LVSEAGGSPWQLFREDAARWVKPQHVSPVELATPRVVLSLLWQHRGLRAMAWVRLAAWLKQHRVRGAQRFITNHLVSTFGLEIGPVDRIGGGCYIAHPVGCTLQFERLGRNATIIAAVTVGARSSGDWPRIGDTVFFGTGARVIGKVQIGDNARLGANTVVLRDVPASMTAIGIPARIVPSSDRLP
ncbi:MAG: serine O-acetyltransferase, partial [Ilumatobacteraceae bacterium]